MNRRRLALSAAAASALTLSLLSAVGPAGSAGAVDPVVREQRPAAGSPLTLIAPQRATIDYYGEGEVYGDLGLRIAAEGGDTRFTTRRASWDVAPVTTFQTPTDSGRVPRRMIRGFDRLRGFVVLTVRDTKGKLVKRIENDTCLNAYEPQRMGPGSPARSAYPYGCPSNPFTIGAIQGITDGYGVGAFEEYASLPLTPGSYRVTAEIPAAWRDLLGIATEDARATYPLRVRKASDDSWFSPRARAADARTVDGKPIADRAPAGRGISLRSPALPAAEPDPQPAGDGAPVPDGPLPDLRSLPAFDIGIGRSGHHLDFAATVWNAGDSPLVVDGFRHAGMAMMDSYQNFYDEDGEQTGYQRVGSMMWHDAPSHNHWHFMDFARYSLLSMDGEEVFRSRKASFCLANTDAVDLTLPGADWQPDGTDLSTACGEESSQSVRQVLSAGSGDTYGQFRAGQSFNLDGLPNGAYWIAVQANPEGNLVERVTSDEDNIALRKVWIGGKPGKRTVRVPAVGRIKAP